jgi:hypothetical protein
MTHPEYEAEPERVVIWMLKIHNLRQKYQGGRHRAE